jgi:hypothetical protein
MARRWKKLSIEELAKKIGKYRSKIWDKAERMGRQRENRNPTPSWMNLK